MVAWLVRRVAKEMKALRDAVLYPELAEHGNGPGRGNKRVYIINSFTGGGTSEAYLIRRLKRDRLDLHAKSAPAGPL